MALRIYIHIPFCISKCIYCNFYSITDLSLKEKYLKFLEREISLAYRNEEVNSIYIGGGTPSILKPEELERIIKVFKKGKDCEISIECNPEDVDFEKMKGYKAIGINRVSIGIQSLEPLELLILKRRHERKKALNAMEIVSSIFENFSFDFIVGIKGQEKEKIKENLKILLSFFPPHISVYAIEMKNKSLMEEEDKKARLLTYSWKILEDRGYLHYEISNFAKDGFICKHNMGYWRREDYLGFGPSAHSCIKKIRFSNFSSIKKYFDFLKKGRLPISKKEYLSEEEIKWEEFILSMRTYLGYEKRKIENLRADNLEILKKEGFINEKEGKIYLKDKGMALYNSVILNLIS